MGKAEEASLGVFQKEGAEADALEEQAEQEGVVTTTCGLRRPYLVTQKAHKQSTPATNHITLYSSRLTRPLKSIWKYATY